MGWEVDTSDIDSEALMNSVVSDGPDPDIGMLKKPRLVSKVRHCLATGKGRWRGREWEGD